MTLFKTALSALILACGLATSASAQQSTPYATIGNWVISQVRQGGQVSACEAMTFFDTGDALLFRHDRDTTMIGFRSEASGNSPYAIDVDLFFDHDGKYATAYAMQPFTDADGIEWRALVMSNNEPWGEIDQFRSADSIHFGYDTGNGWRTVNMPLSRSARAADETFACVQDASAPQQSDAAAMTTANANVIYGSCKLIVGGQTYVDMNAGCPIWLANNGSGEFWINADRENYLGQFFANIVPNGDGTASGWWNASAGATHAQAPLGEGFTMRAGGCWSNGNATVCAAR